METERRERVLVVHHDAGLAEAEATSLRRLGYVVEQCAGPAKFACPVMRGERCLAVERAEVLVYDVWATTESDGGQRLVEELRELYPDKPVVLTAPGMLLAWVETEGAHKVTPLEGVPTSARLDAAIREALSEAGELAGAGPRR
jgi:DNA-binding NtrC family response regulator